MYRTLIIICLAISTLGCSLAGTRTTNSRKAIYTRELEEIHSVYLRLSSELRTNDSWYYGEDCDGILFESLLSVGSGQPSDINLAQIEPGHYYRNPMMTGCDHDISRDMLLGVYWYAWEFQRLDIVEDLWNYGSSNNWKMGEGDSRTILTPGMVGLLSKLVYKLGGESHAERFYTETQYSTTPGYQSHLTLLHILLDGELNKGQITDIQLDTLEKIASKNHGNPLAQAAYHLYTDGDQSTATNLLVNTWPRDRLPNNTDWCESWRTQRADGDSGFEPCNRRHTHSGGDLMFVVRVMGM